MTGCLLWLAATWSVPLSLVEMVNKGNYADKDMIASVITVESAWKPEAESGAGAQGLMQVMPDTANRLASLAAVKGSSVDVLCLSLPSPPYQLKDPLTSILVGSCLMEVLDDKYEGDMFKMLLDYHGGPKAVHNFTKYGLDRVNPTTRAYVKKVSRIYLQCKNR